MSKSTVQVNQWVRVHLNQWARVQVNQWVRVMSNMQGRFFYVLYSMNGYEYMLPEQIFVFLKNIS